jgi:hypothetical protein
MEIRGKRAICAFEKRAWRTVLFLIEKEGYPAAMIGGTWVADEGEIKAWRIRKLRRRDS